MFVLDPESWEFHWLFRGTLTPQNLKENLWQHCATMDCVHRTQPHYRLPIVTSASWKLDPRNARQHSKKQIRQIADSIATFGFNVRCIVDQELCVVSGHGRLAAARLLELEFSDR